MIISDLSYCESLPNSSQLLGGISSQAELTQQWSQFLGVPPQNLNVEKLGQWYSPNGYSETYKFSGSSSQGDAIVGLYSVTTLSSS